MKAFFATVQIPRPERGDAFQIGGPIDADFYRQGEQEWAASRREALQQQVATADKELAELRKVIASRLGEDFTTTAMPLLQTFDALVCDESRPRRRSSVTPLQALAMYNGEFVNEEAKHFADRIKELVRDDPQQQIRYAFELALGRPPSAAESSRLQVLVESANSRDEGLIGSCRVLYNASEFVISIDDSACASGIQRSE